MPSANETVFVSTTPGLEPALDRELRALGLNVRQVPGGAEVSGPAGLHRLLNLRLRTASRVVLRVAEFPARDVPALQRGLTAASLGAYWDGKRPLRIGVSTHKSRLHHTDELRRIAARVWNATLASAEPPPGAPPVSVCRGGPTTANANASADTGSGEDAATTGASAADGRAAPPSELLVQLRLDADVCTVSVDTSGELLYFRGYRQEVSRAPLRETLAAGMLALADYRGDEPLWDPMCGSGTLPIEGAWIALKHAPGFDRVFAFEAFPSHDAAAWEREREESKAQQRASPPSPIYATDVNAGALGTARRNAKRAGVQSFLKLERADVLTSAGRKKDGPRFVPPAATHGLLVANLPYGIRVGDRSELPPLYGAIGALIRDALPGWRAAVLVAEGTDAERHLDLEVDDAFPVDNGGIRCQLLLVRRR